MPAPSFPLSGIARRALVWSGRLLLVLYFAAGSLILVGRHFLMPQIAGQQALVEAQLGAALGLPVSLSGLSAEWPGLHPRLTLQGLQIHDASGRPVLRLDHVDAEIGWSSLLTFGLRLHRLEIVAPHLDIHRDGNGAIFIAGLPLAGSGDGGFAQWLLAQGRIVVRDATVTWRDELRGAPPFELARLNFELRNFGSYHSFGARAEPPAGAAARIDLRGNLGGSDIADPGDWRGELYADLAAADLTAWRAWLDLPLEWSRGHGDVRLWLNFADRALSGLIAELRLADVAVKLRPDLPELVLPRLAGRLDGRRDGDGYVVATRRLTLATQDGIVLPPTDTRLHLMPAGRQAGGEFAANILDIGALADLAGHLPLPEGVHARLREFRPRGQLSDLEVRWKGPAEMPTYWQAKLRFDGLALAAYRELPEFSGLSGRLAGDARSGDVHLDSRDLHIELPAVFAEAAPAFSQFEADAGWLVRDEGIDLRLTRATFRNDDARGEAAGSYRYTGKGPGEIDLSAKLANAAGSAVWRYMPLAVNKDARDWLRRSIVGGRSENATLRLKGPLAEFPFRDGKTGIFQVRGAIRGGTLDYAPGWPRIAGIDGELLFEGARMLISARRGEIMGVQLADVRAEIPDLDTADGEMMVITGKARGETQRFLDFIEDSPIGERIDHFTDAMRATGRGELNLRLDMPLRKIVDTRVKGTYRFADNTLRVLPALPSLTFVQGEFGFTADQLLAKGLRGQWFGMPFVADVANDNGGKVRVEAQGHLAVQALRQEFDHPIFGHLSGETAWRGTVMVKKPAAEVLLEAGFDGISSSLPEPFNKSAGTPLPLKVTGRIESQRNRWTAELGQVARLQLQQAGPEWRGRVALGEAARQPVVSLPEHGLSLAVAVADLDVDRWRTLLAATANGAAATSPLPLAGVKIRSDALRLQQRDFRDVRIDGALANEHWRFAIDSREVRGQLDWTSAGAGRVTGRFATLTLPAAARPAEPDKEAPDTTQELPDVDLAIDDFRLGTMALGSLRVVAENRGSVWQARGEAKNEAARLAGTGKWRPSPSAPETSLDFRLDVDDAEKLLGRMGMPDAVRRGSGNITGSLSWAGTPFGFDLPSLAGQMKADIGKGQFKKLEPGVGRLLGVLSLQSLPRRITLDFRDIFSEGFAFDSIAGSANIARGIMQTDELKIRGPAAKILLSGRINLMAETQDLKVRVQPALGESLAVGAMITNPIAGAVAWAAQKLLNDPLDQAFAYEYAVSGPWNDPQVEKINRNAETDTKAATP